jgi:hypothetical protein
VGYAHLLTRKTYSEVVVVVGGGCDMKGARAGGRARLAAHKWAVRALKLRGACARGVHGSGWECTWSAHTRACETHTRAHWACVHGCMSAWVHECMGAWVHECMGA